MHRNFEEMGVQIDGIPYGHFTGEAQFDEAGSVVVIDIERSSFDGPALRLDIDDLVRERIALRRKHGLDFLSDGAPGIRGHVIKLTLFQALSASIEKYYEEDIAGYLVDAREARAVDAA
jgi:hypothetical protein